MKISSTSSKHSSSPSPKMLPLSPSSTVALAMANGMRLEQGASKVHMEHLLLGLYHAKQESPTRTAFEEAGISEQEVRAALNKELDLELPTEMKAVGFEEILPPLSKHTRQALEAAESNAMTAEDDRIRTRHLLAGFLSLHKCTVVKVVRRLAPNFGKSVVGQDLLKEEEESSGATPEDPQSDEIPHDARVQPLANDTPQGPDLLDIEREVFALAEAIALKEMRPPLVVGILGGWGAGKSFVLHLLEERLGRIRCENLKPGEAGGDRESEEFPYVGHPYVIRFDAWTYAKADLWASLMQTIFIELHRQIGLEHRLAEELGIDALEGTEIWRLLSRLSEGELRKLLETELGEKAIQALPRLEREALETQDLWDMFQKLKAEEHSALEDREKELAKARLELETAQKDLEEQVDQQLAAEARREAFEPFRAEFRGLVGSAARAAWDKQPPEIHELGREISAWRRIFQGWSGNSTAFALFAVVTLIGPPLLSLLPNVGQWIQEWIGEWTSELRVGGLFATCIAAMESLRGFREWLQGRRQAYEERLESARQRQTLTRELVREEKLQELQADAAVSSSLDQLEENVRKLEAEVENHRHNVGLTAEHPSLLDFVQGRLQSGLYEQRLGLLHQAQKDLAELTEAFLPQASDRPDQEEERRKLFPRGEPRVVLMIDDLDRCPPQRVVEVLEAAQLLVKTRLFVVVLAMDVRYITRALEKVYRGVLTRDGEPSGLDYIEKIVQIPYRVRPMRKEALGAFLNAQMRIGEAFPEEAPLSDEFEEDFFIEGEGTRTYLGDSFEMELETPSSDREFSKSGSSAANLGPELPQSAGQRGIPDSGSSPMDHGAGEAVGSSAPEQASYWLRGSLPLRVQEFQPLELELLKKAIGVVEISPRAARRLVNVLKLLKIIWYRRGPEGDPSSEVKQAMLGLLAAAAHYPEVLRELLVDLERAFRNNREGENLLAFLQERCQAASKSGSPSQSEAAHNTGVCLQRILPHRLQLREFGHRNLTLVSSFSFVGESEGPPLGEWNQSDSTRRSLLGA